MIDASFFSLNRQRLFQSVQSEVIILCGHTLVQSSNDMSFGFQQEANFWYLTGINAPGWTVVIEKNKASLIAPQVDEIHQIFDGSLLAADAKVISGADIVLTFNEGDTFLKTLATKYSSVATLAKDPNAARYDFTVNPAPLALHRQLKKSFSSIEDCRLELAKLRAIKQSQEIAAIRSAIDLTIQAFKKVKKTLAQYEYEYQIEAEFTHHFRSNGASGHAYNPIVASGKHACTLHYTDNNSQVVTNGLILLDVGARHHGYAADITRTYSLGTPTKRQKDVQQAVESAHKEIIALLKPGMNVVEYVNKVDEIMKSKLQVLGLLNNLEDYRKYFPHSVSHGLGIDVHDALGRPDVFTEGMVLTVEPGIYIPEEGIGVRIEDDILITKTGHENLSAALPTSL